MQVLSNSQGAALVEILMYAQLCFHKMMCADGNLHFSSKFPWSLAVGFQNFQDCFFYILIKQTFWSSKWKVNHYFNTYTYNTSFLNVMQIMAGKNKVILLTSSEALWHRGHSSRTVNWYFVSQKCCSMKDFGFIVNARNRFNYSFLLASLQLFK